MDPKDSVDRETKKKNSENLFFGGSLICIKNFFSISSKIQSTRVLGTPLKKDRGTPTTTTVIIIINIVIYIK